MLPSRPLLRLALAGLVMAAQVPDPPPAVSWRAPASCPDRAAVLRGVEARLGRPLRPGELAFTGVVDVHATPPLYRLSLRLRVGGHSEQRSLGAETCGALVDATAVLAALVVTNNPPPQRPQILAPTIPPPPTITPPPSEPPGLEIPPPPLPDEPEPEPERPDTPAPAIAPPPAAPTFTTPAPSAPPRPTLGGFLRVHGGLELGALPRFTGAVGLAAGLLWRRARLELQAVYLPPRTGTTALGPVRADLIAGAVHGCARPGRGSFEIPLCAGLELGAMRGSAPDGRAAANWWLAGVISAGLALHVHPRWTVWTALQSATAIIKPNFVAAGPGDPVTLFQSALTTGRLLLGVEVKFSDPR